MRPMTGDSKPTIYSGLLQNDTWLKDLSLMCEWALSYRTDPEISKSFSAVVEYYAKILKHRADPESLARDTNATLEFMHGLMRLSRYGEQYDSSLRNTADNLAAAMLKALPNLKSHLLDAYNRSGLPKGSPKTLSRN